MAGYSDAEIRGWASMARARGGSFVEAIGGAILCADQSNFLLLRGAAEQLMDKYPKYLEWARAEWKQFQL